MNVQIPLLILASLIALVVFWEPITRTIRRFSTSTTILLAVLSFAIGFILFVAPSKSKVTPAAPKEVVYVPNSGTNVYVVAIVVQDNANVQYLESFKFVCHSDHEALGLAVSTVNQKRPGTKNQMWTVLQIQ